MVHLDQGDLTRGSRGCRTVSPGRSCPLASRLVSIATLSSIGAAPGCGELVGGSGRALRDPFAGRRLPTSARRSQAVQETQGMPMDPLDRERASVAGRRDVARNDAQLLASTTRARIGCGDSPRACSGPPWLGLPCHGGLEHSSELGPGPVQEVVSAGTCRDGCPEPFTAVALQRLTCTSCGVSLGLGRTVSGLVEDPADHPTVDGPARRSPPDPTRTSVVIHWPASLHRGQGSNNPPQDSLLLALCW